MDMKETALPTPATTDGIGAEALERRLLGMSLDLPCHGADAQRGVRPLDCWTRQIAAGDNEIFLNFCAGLFGVLDVLGASKVGSWVSPAEPMSRITCAAYDERFADLALEIPLTDLNYLTEFKSLPVDETLFGTISTCPTSLTGPSWCASARIYASWDCASGSIRKRVGADGWNLRMLSAIKSPKTARRLHGCKLIRFRWADLRRH